jgi:hypothetical protein
MILMQFLFQIPDLLLEQLKFLNPEAKKVDKPKKTETKDKLKETESEQKLAKK